MNYFTMHGIPVVENRYDYDEPRYCPPQRNQFANSNIGGTICPICDGRGKALVGKCKTCNGQGLVG